MLTHDQLGFHNVAELVPAPSGGLHLARFPASVWPNVGGSFVVRNSNGCEIRFVTEAPRVHLYLRSLYGQAETQHLRGNHLVRRESRIPEGQIHCVQIDLDRLEPNRTPACRAHGGFDSRVYRVYSVDLSALAFHGVQAIGGDLRPPNADELPKRRWLAYGSSITQGSSYDNFVNAAATLLDADASNLGMAGTCRIEKQIVDFIAGRDDWDFATFELGINLRQNEGENTSFASKVDYLLSEVTRLHPEKPLFLITIFDNGMFHEKEPGGMQRDLLEKNEILRDAARRFSEQVTLVDGQALIPDFRGFRVDLLHPEGFASVRMGIALADIIRPVLEARGL